MLFAADSDSELSRGYCSCLVSALDGARPEEVLDVDTADLAPLGVAAGARSRANTWHNVLVGMKKLARAAIAAREGRPRGEPFPSLVIARDGAVRAQGSYAKAQVRSRFFGLHFLITRLFSASHFSTNWKSATFFTKK
jgi:quinolinate synthase